MSKPADRTLFDSEISSGADFSPCRKYRYSLWRRWDSSKQSVRFIGLNPSTADESVDDPTIRRCIGFAKEWGYGGIIMLNIFAFRATDPNEMKATGDPVGMDNDRALAERAGAGCGLVVAAWGSHGSFKNRDQEVLSIITNEVKCLGKTKAGNPKHPLYLRADTKLEDYWI